MKRRSLLAVTGCAVVPLSGCVAKPGSNGGLLELLEATPPEAATVTPADDERIRTVEPVQRALDRASAAESGTEDARLGESAFDAVATALAELPWYERGRDGASGISGIYLRHEGETFVASLWPYCSDAVLGSAESERGTYGRGGCLDPEDRPGDGRTTGARTTDLGP